MTPVAFFQDVSVEPLSGVGTAIMAASIGTVLVVLGYCLFKVLTLPPVEPVDEPETR